MCLSSLCVLQTYAVSVYLHPTPPTAVPGNLDPAHASFALARHFGLERFEKLGEGDGVWTGGLELGSEGMVGSAPRDALLVSMTEDDAKGERIRLHPGLAREIARWNLF